MNATDTAVVDVAPEAALDLATATEHCPWCGTKIPKTKFLEIQTRIREQEKKKLDEERKKLELSMKAQLQTEVLKVKEQIQKGSDKQVQAAVLEMKKAVQQRDQAFQQMKDKEAAIKKQAQQEAEGKFKTELTKTRTVLENDHERELAKKEAAFARERDALQKKLKQIELKLQQQRSNELGDGAEIDVYEALREAFEDKITRIKKGEPGADIRHDILHKGEVCGTIIYDSKNRQLWQNAYAQKLRADQVAAGANYAILTTTAFPSGKKELCLVDDVIVVNPARLISVVELLRAWMIRLHLLGLSAQQRKDKTAKLYEFITSETFNRQCKEIGRLNGELLDLDVDEKKQHDRVWSKRGNLLTRQKRVHHEMETQVMAILEGVDE